MKPSKVEVILAAGAMALSVASAAVAANEPVIYGRAGFPVAEARIEQLSHLRASDRVANANVVHWYGRAGGPVGLERAAVRQPEKAYAAGQARSKTVYGRAGMPLPFGG